MSNIAPIGKVKDPMGFVKPGVVKFNPAQANAVFRNMRYEFNRDEGRAKSTISAFARMMRAGTWRPMGAIDFARTPDGKLTLVDGHHRMLAQVEAGVDVLWNVVIHEVPDDAAIRNLFWTYDTTMRVRSMANVMAGVNAAEDLGISKVMANRLPAAAIFIGCGMNANVGAGAIKFTPDEKLSWVREWGREAAMYERFIKKADAVVKRKMISAQVMAVALVTIRAKPQIAETFWSGIANDDGLRKGDPRKTLLDWMRDSHLASTSYTGAAAAAARAWQAWVDGRQLTAIRIGAQPVSIAGTKLAVTP